jgi:transcriptional regulator of acetoin/glycerol metabolism
VEAELALPALRAAPRLEVTVSLLARFAACDWPGNVRQDLA